MTSRSYRHRGGPLRRAVTSSAVRRSILIFTEGEKTEVQYLKAWERKNRQKVLLAIDRRHGLSPLDMVRCAVGVRRHDLRDENRGRGSAYSEVWCVFDKDDHANMQQAHDLAGGNGIKIALSNPCFELWLVLHDRDHQAWISTADVQSLSASMFGAGKSLSLEIADGLIDRLGDAIQRARQLEQKHTSDGNDPNENPSSAMWHLVETLGN